MLNKFSFKKIYLILSRLALQTFIYFVLTSCHFQKKDTTAITLDKSKAIDSFSISKLNTSERELSHLSFLNDTTLISFDNFDNLCIYTKKDNLFSYYRPVALQPFSESPRFFYLDTIRKRSYTFKDRTFYTYNSAFTLIDSITLNLSVGGLKTNYFLSATSFLPFIKKEYTFICNYSHADVNDFFKTYNEPALIEFSLTDTSIQNAKTYFRKPIQLKYYDVSFLSSHVNIDNTIYKLYSGFDTLYSYQLNTGKENKIPIRNKDYTLPEKSDLKRLFDFGYRTKHTLASFSYSGMFYNPTSKNLMLFYKTPVAQSTDKNPTSKDQKLKAIVLNSAFKVISYIEFKDSYYNEAHFLIYKNKGIAMPLENEDPLNEKTTFYIYNF